LVEFRENVAGVNGHLPNKEKPEGAKGVAGVLAIL